MLNSKFAHEQAALLAARLQRDGTDDESRVRLGFESVTSRPAHADEVERGLQFMRELQQQDGLTAEKALERLCLLLLNLNEFVYLE
jgi:hypothetical protein